MHCNSSTIWFTRSGCRVVEALALQSNAYCIDFCTGLNPEIHANIGEIQFIWFLLKGWSSSVNSTLSFRSPIRFASLITWVVPETTYHNPQGVSCELVSTYKNMEVVVLLGRKNMGFLPRVGKIIIWCISSYNLLLFCRFSLWMCDFSYPLCPDLVVYSAHISDPDMYNIFLIPQYCIVLFGVEGGGVWLWTRVCSLKLYLRSAYQTN